MRLTGVAAFVSIVLAASPAQAAGPFTDDDGRSEEPFIEAIAGVGVTTGCAVGLYCPDAQVTREEMAVFLVRAHQVTHGSAPAVPAAFIDVAGSFALHEIGALAALGVTAGCTATMFCPDAQVSREQMAVFLARLLGLGDAPSPFTDTSSSFADGEIGAIAEAGITAGCTPTTFCPAGLVTRAEMAIFLTRALGLVPVEPPRILVFTRTEGFRHDSIPAAIAAVAGLDPSVSVTTTEDPGAFTAGNLATFDVVVFLHTTGDVLDPPHEAALQSYVETGGGYIGVHAAADTEATSVFYRTLLGARFVSHPAIQPATVRVEDAAHRAATGLPETWVRTDEWYNFDGNPRPDVHVLATVDEATYSGGTMGADHPIAWCHAVGAGRSWYTALGHTVESWTEPLFLAHVREGLRYALGDAPCG